MCPYCPAEPSLVGSLARFRIEIIAPCSAPSSPARSATMPASSSRSRPSSSRSTPARNPHHVARRWPCPAPRSWAGTSSCERGAPRHATEAASGAPRPVTRDRGQPRSWRATRIPSCTAGSDGGSGRHRGWQRRAPMPTDPCFGTAGSWASTGRAGARWHRKEGRRHPCILRIRLARSPA